MFTGLIREIGRLKRVSPRGGVTLLDIAAPVTARGAAVGDSIAVNGICLTVTAVTGDVFRVEAAVETRRLTTMKYWRRGDRLHLEPSLRAGDPLDGHLVQGHGDGIGTVRSVKNAGGSLLVTVELPARLAVFLTPKGSVAVDGVSLTVDEGPFTDSFTVNLIGHTLAWTTFDHLRRGRQVNLEMDVLVKAARGEGRLNLPGINAKREPTNHPQSSWTMERLLSKGFTRRRSSKNG